MGNLNEITVLSPTTNGSALNGYNIDARRIGNVVYVHGYINPKSAGNNLTIFGNMPKPVGTDVIAPCTNGPDSTSIMRNGWCRINSNTNDIQFTVPEASKNYCFCFTYITAD